MQTEINRRRFLGSAVATGAYVVVPRSVLGGDGYVAPSERIRLGHIGMGSQSIRELGGLLNDNRIQIVAVCDPNRRSWDYLEWGRYGIRNQIREYLKNPDWGSGEEGCPGGREVGKEIIEGWYARQADRESYKGCAVYADFREMLEREKDLDAVKIMTPDHLHAHLSIAAMKKGLHVLMHKPIANRVYEGRKVLETVRASQRATHLLAYGSGYDNGRIVERIKEGAIGKLREIHNWTNRPVWPQYTEISAEKPPVPDGFDWDLWLGPAQYRPYHPHYTHTVYRGWYEFGGGSMADMGIYSLWPVFTGLGLPVARTAEAWATHTCDTDHQVCRRVNNDFAYPTGCTLRFHFAAGENRDELDLFWYDGGMRPRLPQEIERHEIEMGQEGILFVGDGGSILADFHGGNPRLFAGGKSEALPLNEVSAQERGSGLDLWIRGCQGKTPSPGNFLNAESITDTVNLGTVALRAGKKVVFDSNAIMITNPSGANQYLYRDYRKGWEL